MTTNKAIEVLKEHIRADKILRNDNTESDYDKFCERKSFAIETIISKFEKVREVVGKIESIGICVEVKNVMDGRKSLKIDDYIRVLQQYNNLINLLKEATQ